MLRCSLWRPPNVHANCHAAQISQQAQGQDYFHSVSTSPVPQPAQSTLVSVCFSVSLVHTVHLRYLPCVSNGRPIYTLSTGAGSVKRERWTALVAYSWFSTVDEALFQQSTQKSAILWLSFRLSLPIMERGQIRPFSQICVLQKHTYAVERSVLKE